MRLAVICIGKINFITVDVEMVATRVAVHEQR